MHSKRFFAALLAAVMLMTMLPGALMEPMTDDALTVVSEPIEEQAWVLGDDSVEGIEGAVDEQDAFELDAGDEPAGDGELEYEQEECPWDFDPEAMFEAYAGQMFGIPGSRRLFAPQDVVDQFSGNARTLYLGLVDLIHRVASGEIDGETETSYDASNLNVTKAEWPLIRQALYTSVGPELYWYRSMGTSSYTDSDYIYKVYLYVAEDYQNGDDFHVNTSRIQTARQALANAQDIVSKNASLPDYDKLHAYKDAICDLVDYDYDSLEIDPLPQYTQHLINVFDGDPDTKVVCTGYSRAFQYLCDQSTFQQDVRCNMAIGIAGGLHAWDLVYMPTTQKNYLVDVTWCDDNNGGSSDRWFMIGAESGDVSGGYVFNGETRTYDEEYVLNVYKTSQLTVSNHDYLTDLENAPTPTPTPTTKVTPTPTPKVTPTPTPKVTPTPTPTPVPGPVIHTILLTANTRQTVSVGEKYQIDLGGSIAKSYKSSKPKIATVSASGLVTPLKKDSAKITVTLDTKKKKTLTLSLTVVDPTVPTKLTLNHTGTFNHDFNEPLQLTYTLEPAGKAVSEVTWKSSSSKIASVDEFGFVTPHKTGKVTITATAKKNKKATAKVTVNFVDPSYPTKLKLGLSGTVDHDYNEPLLLTYTLEPAGKAISDVTWKSSATKIATVDKYGHVTFHGTGRVTITATTTKNKSATAKVTLNVFDPSMPTGITLDKKGPVTIDLSEFLNLKATLQPAGAYSDVIWTSSSEKIATVDNGLVKPVKAGTVTITAKLAKNTKKSAKVKVTIKDKYAPTKVEITQGKSVTLQKDQSMTLTAKVTADQGLPGRANLTWTSSKSGVVSVDAHTGKITAVGAGTAKITVTTDNRKKDSISVNVSN